MISRAKRKKLVELYPYDTISLAIARLIRNVAADYGVPTHMLYGVSRQTFRHKNPQHQQIPRSKEYKFDWRHSRVLP